MRRGTSWCCSNRPSHLSSRRLHSDKPQGDRKSTRLNSIHGYISYAVFCLQKKHLHAFQGCIATQCRQSVDRLSGPVNLQCIQPSRITIVVTTGTYHVVCCVVLATPVVAFG